MRRTRYHILTVFIAVVWLVNGLLCKLLHLVPRHQQIVGSIMGEANARVLTLVIGFLEVLMAAWILSGIRPRLAAYTQVVLVITMNVMEFYLVPELLLFGRWNMIFALLFVALILVNEYVYRKKLKTQAD